MRADFVVGKVWWRYNDVTSSNRDHMPWSLYYCLGRPSLCSFEVSCLCICVSYLFIRWFPCIRHSINLWGFPHVMVHVPLHWRPCWEDPRMQYQIVRKSKRFILQFPTATSSSTRSMTVYPIYSDQGSTKFFGEDNISYCTTVRRSDILRNVFLGYVTFYQNNTFFVNILFFLYWQNVLRAGEMASQFGFSPRVVV